MVNSLDPWFSSNLTLAYSEESASVQVPADLLVRSIPPVDNNTIEVVTSLASHARQQSAPKPRIFTARPQRTVTIAVTNISASKGTRVLIKAIYVLQDVDLPVLGPCACADHPEC